MLACKDFWLANRNPDCLSVAHETLQKHLKEGRHLNKPELLHAQEFLFNHQPVHEFRWVGCLTKTGRLCLSVVELVLLAEEEETFANLKHAEWNAN